MTRREDNTKEEHGTRRPFGRSAAIIGVVVFLIAALISAFYFSPSGTQAEEGFLKGVVISEFMPLNNDAWFNEYGDASDWIELTNTGVQSVNLYGWSLSDNPAEPGKFVFPDVHLDPGEYILVFAAGKKSEQRMYADFALKSAGESVVLFTPSGGVTDSVVYDAVNADESVIRDFETGDISVTNTITPGYPNTEAGYQAFMDSLRARTEALVINEISNKNFSVLRDEDGEYSNWVELKNSSDKELDLSAFALTDTMSKPIKWRFPRRILGPGEYLLVFLSGKDKTGEQLHTSFRLAQSETQLFLTTLNGKSTSSVTIPDTVKPDMSYGFAGQEWQVLRKPTPGFPNTPQGEADFEDAYVAGNIQKLFLSEVMLANAAVLTSADAQPRDWIELHNAGNSAVNLGKYYLSDNVQNHKKWQLPEKELAPGEYLVVYASGKDLVRDGEVHASFRLNPEEPVLLSDENSAVDRLYPSFSSLAKPTQISYGRGRDLSTQYMTSPTPGSANAAGVADKTETPVFSVDGGVFEQGDFEVALAVNDGSTIRYTLDGTAPNASSAVYTKPLRVTDTKVIRAQSYREGAVNSQSVSRTYVIAKPHDLPVVCLSAAPASLFSESSGIYTNYSMRTEVPAHIEYYPEPGKAPALDQNFALRIFGSFSRANAAKSFALFARSSHGPSSFACKLFDTQPYTEYDAFILRNGASETFVTKIVDVTLCSLVRDTTRLATQDYRPCVVYINGVYWGIYFIQEKINESYLSQHYGVSKDKINLLQANGGTVLAGDKTRYADMVDYVETHNMADNKHYAYIQTQMDVDNYIDYVICQMYVNNTDTGNIKYWMSDEYDGRWRWIFYDVDWAFWFRDMNGLKVYTNPQGHGVGRMFSNTLLLGLLKNEEFKQRFIERFAFHIKVTFEPDRVVTRIDEIAGAIDSEIPRDKARWGGSYAGWANTVEARRDYARHRNNTAKQHLKEYFGLSEKRMKELFG